MKTILSTVDHNVIAVSIMIDTDEQLLTIIKELLTRKGNSNLPKRVHSWTRIIIDENLFEENVFANLKVKHFHQVKMEFPSSINLEQEKT